ncbi:MAG: hypothetical protein WCK10_01340 [Candidatus Staskawiczbacteria bacterium]
MPEISKHDLDPDSEIKEQPINLAVPVESIIPDIKEPSIEKSHVEYNNATDDFWRIYISEIASGYRSKEKNSKISEGLKLFENQTVVDLGAGSRPSGYLLSQLLGAKAYVGVEICGINTASLENNSEILNTYIDWVKKNDVYRLNKCAEIIPDLYASKIPYSIVNQDMLSFLKRLPDNSVSITMGGVGPEIMKDNEYWKEVFKEVERVLSKNGGFLYYASGPASPDVKFDVAYEGPTSGDYIFKKSDKK